MSLSWQDVACGLPVPELPVLPEGWRTRFFSAVLIVPEAQAEQLRSVSEELLADGLTVLLPQLTGAGWPCRLVAAPELAAAPDGRLSARLEFEVVEQQAVGPGRAGPERGWMS